MRQSILTDHYGLITDCLSEFCREMRKRDFTHILDHFFRLNSDFNKRDEIAVRKTFSGLAKLIFPDERMGKEDVRWVLEYAIEGRRRVKEQLKIMAGIEFKDVNLGYVDADNPKFVQVIHVPEQPDETLIPEGPLMPGHVFGVGRSLSGDVAVYKLENRGVRGDAKFKMEGVSHFGPVRDAMNAAFEFFRENARRLGPGVSADQADLLLFYNDLQGKGPSDEVSLAEFVGLCSVATNRPVAPSMAIPGILRLSGTMDDIRNLEDIMRVAKNAGAKRILLPFGCLRDLQNIPQDLVGGMSTDFYPDGDALAAARKALDL